LCTGLGGGTASADARILRSLCPTLLLTLLCLGLRAVQDVNDEMVRQHFSKWGTVNDVYFPR